MIALKITAYPKDIENDEIPYLDIDENINKLELICTHEEGVNIKSFNRDGKINHICELYEDEAVKIAEMILAFCKKQ